MKQKLKSIPLVLAFAVMTFGTAFASECGDNAYWIDTGSSFWKNKQTGGCDFIDENGCLVHVEIYTKYRLWINMGTYETVLKLC
ncbi:MAG: hypothetical protein K2Y12_07050 [Chitinophagaceae bacterium]|jgi:hypothetical protein|nr:hypothetical protein [Chitinophagaceae bacterium]